MSIQQLNGGFFFLLAIIRDPNANARYSIIVSQARDRSRPGGFYGLQITAKFLLWDKAGNPKLYVQNIPSKYTIKHWNVGEARKGYQGRKEPSPGDDSKTDLTNTRAKYVYTYMDYLVLFHILWFLTYSLGLKDIIVPFFSLFLIII